MVKIDNFTRTILWVGAGFGALVALSANRIASMLPVDTMMAAVGTEPGFISLFIAGALTFYYGVGSITNFVHAIFHRKTGWVVAMGLTGVFFSPLWIAYAIVVSKKAFAKL